MKTSISQRFIISVKRLVTLTFELVTKEELLMLEMSFKLVEKMLTEGEQEVQDVLAEIYIPGIKQFLEEHKKKDAVLDIMPPLLRLRYIEAEMPKSIESSYNVFEIWLN